ncbi:MAG: glycosyltransferase, partial [bacterium]
MADDTRVLMVAPQPFYETRGMPISVFLRCQAMARQGCTIDLVTYPMGESKVPYKTNLHRIPNLLFLDHVPAGPSIRKFILDLILFCYLFVFLWGTDEEYDCLQAHEEGALLCAPLARIFGLPLVYDHHSNLGEITRDSSYAPFARLMNGIENWGLALSDIVVCVIPALLESIQERVSHNEVYLIPDTAPEEIEDTSVDASLSSSVQNWLDEDKLTLVYTGSLAGYQTMDSFLKGLADCRNRESLQFLLVGGTEDELAELRPLLDDLELGETVKLTGRVP